MTVLDDDALQAVSGGRLSDQSNLFGKQKPPPTAMQTYQKRNENLCARHWLAEMGLGEDREGYRAGCKLMELDRASPMEYNGPMSAPTE